MEVRSSTHHEHVGLELLLGQPLCGVPLKGVPAFEQTVSMRGRRRVKMSFEDGEVFLFFWGALTRKPRV